MKRWIVVVIAIVAVVFVLILGKDFIAKQAVLVGIKAITGLDSQMDSMKIGDRNDAFCQSCIKS